MFDDARQLYSVPPSDFTAARNQLARTLKAAGRGDEAAFVTLLKRPKITEWAVNRVAHEQPEIVGRWAQAVIGANTAQAAAIGEAASGVGFRKAADELKAATNALLDAANVGGDDAHRYEIADLVRGLTIGDGPDLLLAGVVGSSPVSEAAGFFPGATTAGPTTSVAGRPPRGVLNPTGSPAAQKGEKAAASPPRVGVRAREQLTAKAERAQTELAAAKAAASEAQKLVDRAGRELERLQRDLQTRVAALDAAKRRSADLTQQLRELGPP